MSLQIPACLLRRTLRSSSVLERVTVARTSPEQSHLFGLRPYSQAVAESEETHPSNETAASSEPLRKSTKSNRNAPHKHRRFGHNGPVLDVEKRKQEERLLMAIASGSTPESGEMNDEIRSASYSRKTISMELKWLEDPRDLADRVARLLRSGDPGMAAALVRQAQKDGKRCDVAWNHLLSYCMQRGFPQAAFKLYNDMKKRGRMPSSVTYTLMLKGLADAPKSPANIKMAESIYRSIEHSDVDLSIIHTNAMLSVCDRHHDMDSLWRIAGELPEEGPQAPDMRTYTIILGALQYSARNDLEKISPADTDKIVERKDQMVMEGKRIWADVLYRWTKDQLQIDNHVVNAMASLLLEGARERDYYDVLALYNQTMGIPIFAKKPAETQKASRFTMFRLAFLRRSAAESDHTEDVPFVDEHNRPLREEPEKSEKQELLEGEEEEIENFDLIFDPVLPKNEGLTYIQPGSKELTFIEDVCHRLPQGFAAGYSYWDYLTIEVETRFEPDAVALAQYMRLLRAGRASKRAVQVMQNQALPSGLANEKLFHLAMACCRRDRNNASVLLHANELLQVMHKALILPDPRVLESYLELVQSLAQAPHVLLNLRGLPKEGRGKKINDLKALGKKLHVDLHVAAMGALRVPVSQLHEALQGGKPERGSRWSALKNGSANIPASLAVKVMARVRTVIDELLKAEYASVLSKEDRKVLQMDSNSLKTYSDKETIKKFVQMSVYPTIDQKNAFQERHVQVVEEAPALTEKDHPTEGSESIPASTASEDGKKDIRD
ncbi:hypothetical protein N7539_005201 [Penicillium diatomitis]|uniref:Pentatricopeptide repeat protein n=1 Tax=Penicillium diatomitis TaxID=2819901 RepID=A0A9W9X6G7_9EURO|nr:uncharacterized protein N7539_005201 [Penicillium diatomitis]KAJ5485213.1 hypothetical protein N7539_005201 [Penicillium diatomitis]